MPGLTRRGACTLAAGAVARKREPRADIPQLEVLDIAGAGHMVAGDRNDVFYAGILSFLERRLPIA